MRGITLEPTGFTHAEDFIDQATEVALLDYLFSLHLQPVTIRGNTSERTAHHFGLRYDCGSDVLGAAEPIPGEIEPQIRRAENVAGLAEGKIVEALADHCPPGAGIGWHTDTAVYKTIIGISIGSSRSRGKQPVEHVALVVGFGSELVRASPAVLETVARVVRYGTPSPHVDRAIADFDEQLTAIQARLQDLHHRPSDRVQQPPGSDEAVRSSR
jgi:hypothetical protein